MERGRKKLTTVLRSPLSTKWGGDADLRSDGVGICFVIH